VALFDELDADALNARDRCDLGVALVGVGRHGEARSQLQRARADDSLTPEATRHLARLVLADGDAERAERLVYETLQISPTDPDAYLVLGEARASLGKADAGVACVEAAYFFLQQNRPQAVHEALDAAERLIGTQPAHLGLRGEAFRLQGRHAEAIDSFDRLLVTDPENAWVRARRSASLAALGLHREAQADAARAAEVAGPDDVAVSLLAGDAALGSGDGPRALAYAEDAFQADPRHPGSYVLRARAELATGSPEHALEFVQAGLALAPHDLGLLRLKARAERRLGDDTAALGSLRALCDSTRSTAEDHHGLARLLHSLGDRGAAIEVVAAALTRWPESADLLVLHGTLLLEGRRLEDAARVFANAADRYPDNPEVLLGLARTAYERGSVDEAARAAAAAARARPEWAEPWALTARIEAADDPVTSAESARKTLALDPDQPDALLIVARRHLRDGDPTAAERVAKRALAAGATDPELTLVRAQALRQRDREAKALRLLVDLPKQVEHDPRLLASWLQTRGELQMSARHWAEAESDLRRVLALQESDPDREVDPGVWFALAEVARVSGDVREAERLARKTLELQPDHVRAHGTLGAALLARGRPEDGEAVLRAAVRLDPAYAFGVGLLAQHLAARNPPEARELMDRALAAAPEDRRLRMERARLEALVGDWGQSLALWEELTASSADVEALVGRSEALRMLGRTHAAVHCAEQAVALDEDDAAAVRALAFALVDDGAVEQAIDVLADAHLRNPDDGHTLADLGFAYRQADRAADALQALDQACLRSPRDPWPLSQLGSLLGDLAHYDAAATVLRRAIQANAEDPSLWGQLGWALLNGDRAHLGEAEAAYRRAVDLDPDDPWSLAGLANALHSQGDSASRSAYERAHTRALDLRPEQPELVSLIAWCQFRLGDPVGAAVLFQEAQAREPRAGSELLDLALTLLCAGRDSRAEHAYRNAVNQIAGRVPGLDGRDPLRQRGLLTVGLLDLEQAFLDDAALGERPASSRIASLLREQLAELPEVPEVRAASPSPATAARTEDLTA
jgi:tetratricopeptide (TPR) repeat protein